jgi:hypothetical protein
MPHLPPPYHETIKCDSSNETKVKGKQNKTVPDSNSNIIKSMTYHNQTKELTRQGPEVSKLAGHRSPPADKPATPPANIPSSQPKRRLFSSIDMTSASKCLRVQKRESRSGSGKATDGPDLGPTHSFLRNTEEGGGNLKMKEGRRYCSNNVAKVKQAGGGGVLD